jgi:hypothetical protein
MGTPRVTDNFPPHADKISRQFYNRFKKEHAIFYAFVTGIDDPLDEQHYKERKVGPKQENKAKQWYVSLLITRLMFCYFIQKKGFLDSDPHYLRNKLEEGINKGESFYHNFLRILFNDGLNGEEANDKVKDIIGRIPYLGGNLFEVHELEKKYEITICNDAFKNIFNFFDQYEWRLDSVNTGRRKYIDPGVIGHIFEKYINDRAKMGAYYTREDITSYISRSCIIPWLFDETKRNYPGSFNPLAEIWETVKQSGDTYIHSFAKHGMHEELPEAIAEGINTASARKEWNKPAPSRIALPTESWREVITRRERYNEITQKISSGATISIHDFVTSNLDIGQFAVDVIKKTDDPKFLSAFYKSLQQVAIIDPTCGSGAFLFAAMNVLEPLYRACLERMERFMMDPATVTQEYFEHVMNQANASHYPARQYFIFRHIILNNLYGVDVMKEAVEITKLGLFLKLIAVVEADHSRPNFGLEPMPDIYFNIRAGNALVGFVKAEQINAMPSEFQIHIHNEMRSISSAFSDFRKYQLGDGKDRSEFRACKNILQQRLDTLKDELDKAYYHPSGKPSISLAQWENSHLPFHWFIEFYHIMQQKEGFDIVIGNPPYVEYSAVRNEYKVENMATEKCGNLYAFIIERTCKILNEKGNKGFIIPLSGLCTQRMESLVQLYKKDYRSHWVSHFGWRPATLFEGVNIPLSVIISNSGESFPCIRITEYYKWYQEKRKCLMSLLFYNNADGLLIHNFVIPKIGREYNTVFRKMFSKRSDLGRYSGKGGHCLYYRNTGGLYWRIILDFRPVFILNGIKGDSSTLASLCFTNEAQMKLAVAVLNSNLFWLYYVAYSSFYHLNPVDLNSFPISFEEMEPVIKERLLGLSASLMADMSGKSIVQTRMHKGGNNSQSQTFYPSLSKPIVDEIDVVLAAYYGFDEKELDDIINYDIRFRLQTDD